MTYERFGDTPVWNAAQALGVDVFALVDDRAFDLKGDLRDQLQRAVLSISNNVAEGFERGTTEDLVWFLYIARGSAGEVRSALHFAVRLADAGILRSEISDLRSRILNLLPRCESVSRQLRGWADSLQNTDVRGQRHLNDATRAAWQQTHRTKEFLEKLDRIRAGAKPTPPLERQSESES
jgi:four helix bundle protein